MLGIKTEVKMPNQKCRRSLTKAMSDVCKSKATPGLYKKRLRSADDNDDVISPCNKRRHLGDTHRRSPRLSKQVTEIQTPKRRSHRGELSKDSLKSQTNLEKKTPSKKNESKKSPILNSLANSGESVDNQTCATRKKSPRKYTIVNNCFDCTVNLNILTDENPMPTKSFYGGSKTPYITPLQRKELANKRASSTSKLPLMSTSSIDKHVKDTRSERHARSKSVSSKSFAAVNSSRRTLAKVTKSHTEEKKTKLETKLVKPNCSFEENNFVVQKRNTNDNTAIQNSSATPNRSKNRFFKHRSPGKKFQLALTRVGVTKNRFNMSFGASKVMKSDVLKTTAKDSIDKNSNLMKPFLNSKRKTVNNFFQPNSDVDILEHEQKSSVQQEKGNFRAENVDSINDNLCNDIEESGRISAMSEISDNYSVCSTGADSVLLLSEVESESGLSPDMTIKNKTDTHDEHVIPQVESVIEEKENLNASAEIESQSSLNDADYVAPTPGAATTSLIGVLNRKSKNVSVLPKSNVSEKLSSDINFSPGDPLASELSSFEQQSTNGKKSMTEGDIRSNIVNVQEILKSNKKLFPIFGPAAQSSPRQSSCPGTPSDHNSITPSNSPCVNLKSSPNQIWKKIKYKDQKEQMMLDFGQKLQQVAPCPVCGITYTRGDPNDETTHSKFHHKMLNILKFSGWRKERVVQDMMDGGRILMVLPDDTQPMKKVNAVKQVVDQELGFVVEGSIIKANTKIFLYVSLDKRIVGFCIAEVISKGYRVLSDDQVQRLMSTKSPTKRVRPLCCSTKPEVAKCGINRIWVLHGERQKGIASKLVDCVRYNFILGNILKHSQLAFSDPTPDGQMFASKYCETPNFLVYRKQS